MAFWCPPASCKLLRGTLKARSAVCRWALRAPIQREGRIPGDLQGCPSAAKRDSHAVSGIACATHWAVPKVAPSPCFLGQQTPPSPFPPRIFFCFPVREVFKFHVKCIIGVERKL